MLSKCFSLDLFSAICLASFSSSTEMNSSPALGTSDKPNISTGVEGPADFNFRPL